MEIITDINIYSLDSIFNSAILYLDKFYFYLDEASEGKIKIQIKAKKEELNLNKLINDFKNELINSELRIRISKENKNVREMIVSAIVYRTESEKKEVFNTEETPGDNILKKFTYGEKIDDIKEISRTWEDVHRNQKT